MTRSDIIDKAEERQRFLLELAQAEVGKNRVGLGNDPKLLKDMVPIEVLDIDEILGGGLRKGRIAMVVGQESMGKTLFTQWVIRAFQKSGEACGFIDPEKTYEAKWFKSTGVDVEKLIVVQPSSTEQAFELACAWSENGMGLIVMDSLAALIPKARVDSSLTDQEFIGLTPRKLGEGLGKFTNINADSLLLCTNQLRSKVGVVYGSPEDIPGGRALRHYASYIIRVKRNGWIKSGDDRVGYHMGIETLKNKLAPPYQSTSIPFMFSGLVDNVVGTLDLAFDLNLIEGKRGNYVWKGEKIRGKEKLTNFFRDNEEELDHLKQLIKTGNL